MHYRLIMPLLGILAATTTGCSKPESENTAMPGSPSPYPTQRPASDDEAYAPGEIDVCEIKKLPAARILEAQEAGEADRQATMNRSFRRLFNTIRENDIPMTTPVEMRSGKTSGMVFYLDENSAKRADIRPVENVNLSTLPERTVASLAVRGSYTPERLAETESKLRAWLAAHTDWQSSGPAYAVYWNSPFMPGFLKKSEVHIPVTAKR